MYNPIPVKRNLGGLETIFIEGHHWVDEWNEFMKINIIIIPILKTIVKWMKNYDGN